MDEYFARKLREIAQNSLPADNGLGCLVWQGALKGVYGAKKLSPPGHKSIVRTAHRALYMCYAKTLEIPPHMDVSHLCHNNLCVKIEHLVLEDHIINMGRLECHNNQMCSRKHQPDCLFPVCYLLNKVFFFNVMSPLPPPSTPRP